MGATTPTSPSTSSWACRTRSNFRGFEAICASLDGRPHWGKMHFRDASSLRTTYPRFDDFIAARDACDPARVFGNAYTDRVLGP